MWHKKSITFKFISLTSLLTLSLMVALAGAVISTANKSQVKQADAFIQSLKNSQAREEQMLREALSQKGETLAGLLSQTGAKLISSYDFDTLKPLAQSVVADQDVAFVTFYDVEENALTEEVKQQEGAIVKTHEIKFEDELVGFVKIALNVESIRRTIADLNHRIDRVVEDTSKTMDEASHDSLTQTAISAFIGIIVLCLAVYFSLNRLIIKPIDRIIERLTNGADKVSSASGHISASSQSLAQGSSEQAASIEETSAALEEMSSITKQNAEHAGQANHLMNDVTEIVSQANKSMADLTTSMEEITLAGEETSKIIKTIDEIAFQTNLLALNAAVEAARAGEAGAGFAVVADEVRNLAMRAAQAAKDTAALIDDTTKKVKTGADFLVNTNESYQKIIHSASQVGELVAQITAASGEQSDGIEQVNKAVADTDKVTQQNVANAEESASASEEMKAQAEEMVNLINELVTLVEGASRGNNRQKSRKSTTNNPELKTQESAHQPEALPHSEKNTDKLIPFEVSEFEDF